uniref:Solute carrier family 5 member 8 n=1 Tax=Oreochromis niloticus TaxID=8128 RepID=I3JU99_ORENI
MRMAVASFALADYVVFALMLVVSAAVGIYYAWVDRSRRNPGNFLTGGRKLTALPVSLSLTASFMSAITVLSFPAEVYHYGANIGFYGLSYLMAMLVTSEVFLPIFYKLEITSTFEVRVLFPFSFLFFRPILYSGIVIYVPALALNQVTGMNLWGVVISTGVVCTFYCTLGGLKAVVWTDVFQLGVMIAGFLSVIIASVILQGGVINIFSDSQHGGRINFWDFDTNPLRRHTFWTVAIGGTFLWTSVYGTNQSQVQRYISCKSITHARFSLFINLLGLWLILLCSVFAGMCLYSIYKSCDPWTSGLLSALDQLMPYLVMDILGDYPGLPGLFVAAAFSGSLSTVSSSINALAAVTVEDLIKPYASMSERQLAWISKGTSLLYGVLCIGMAGLASLLGPIFQAVISIFGVIGGPLLGLFTLGILCPFATSKGALSGVVLGLAVSLWVAIGAQIYPPPPEMSRPLSLTTEGCNFTMTDNFTSGFTTPISRPALADWYSVSYLYFSPIGTIITISVGLIVSVLTGGRKLNVESRLRLTKEDTSLYYLFKIIKDGDRKKTFGNPNPAFCDVELDLPQSSIST